MRRRKARHLGPTLTLLAVAAVLAGCGTTKSRDATQQLLMSDSVDRSIATIDFAPLAGKTVFFDTKYLVAVKGQGFVNAEYVISSLRQQMLASGCLLQDDIKDAEFVVEGRMGALGTDTHEVTYGIPPSSGLSQAAQMLPNVPHVPVPEISLAKREDSLGAAKVALFAYHRETRLPVWQSGISVATSNARDIHILGVGPIQDGTIHQGTHFAGSRMQIPLLSRKQERPPTRGVVSYFDETKFDKYVGQPLEKPTPEELNAEIEALVKVPKLSPLTEQMFAAMGPPAKPAAPASPAAAPSNASEGAKPASDAPADTSAPAASVAERPKPLPAVTSESPPAATPAPAEGSPAKPDSPPPAAEGSPPPGGPAAPTITR